MENFETFKNFGKEIILQSLAVAYEKYQQLKEIDDLGYEVLEKEFFPKYEKLYFSLESKEIEEAYKNSESSDALLNMLLDIMVKNGFTKEYIFSKLEKRSTLGEESGALVIKRLYEYNLKELEKKRSKLLGEADDLLREEYIINNEISNAIQEEEQMELILKIHPVREKFRLIDKELQSIESKIKELNEKLSKKWYYEIYGTTSASELKSKIGADF